jgi:hypothetical protein
VRAPNEKPEDRAKLFRQNIAHELGRLKWTRSATKHRISRLRSQTVLERCLLILEEEPTPADDGASDTRLVFLGSDDSGIDLEVIAVETDQGDLLVIHGMEMRPALPSPLRGGEKMNKVKDQPKDSGQKIFLKSGVELTRELEEDLSAEAERGYDLSEARRHYLDRPLLPDSKSPKITLTLSAHELDALLKRAEEEDCRITDLAHEALRRYLGL